MEILSPKQLWQDFNPESENLDTVVMKTEESGGIVTQHVYFTGRSVSDKAKSRVYGVFCYKNTNSKKNALVVIDDPLKPVDVDELQYWAENGFVAMAVDVKGVCEQGRFTVYPTAIEYANSDTREDDFEIRGSAKNTKWYEYAVNNMRAVTFLSEQPFVKSVSVITVGRGSKIGLMVLAVDKRLTCGAVVFGNLFKEFPSVNAEQLSVFDLEELDKEEIYSHVENNETEQIWTIGLSPQSYVPLINVPLYVVCGGNSGQVNVEKLSQTYYRTNKKSRLLIIPDAFDYLPNYMTDCIVKWLKGKTNDDDMTLSQVDLNDGKLTLALTSSLPMEELELWYCRNRNLRGKNWVVAPLRPSGEEGKYYGTLDLYEENCDLYALAVANGEVAVSTALLPISTKGQFDTKLKTSLLFTGEEDVRFVPLNFTDKWHGREIEIYKCKGYLGIVGEKGSFFGTFAIRDSANRNEQGILSFDVCCDVKQKLRVYCVVDFGGKNRTYSVNVGLIGDGKWQRVIINSSTFREHEGHAMNADDIADMLMFYADDKFIINNVSLV
ncbi:MAG: hypothetical protein NC350_01680 [Corallococcus sp.]|nr:hypothetical protein [Corallococcus sp.]